MHVQVNGVCSWMGVVHSRAFMDECGMLEGEWGAHVYKDTTPTCDHAMPTRECTTPICECACSPVHACERATSTMHVYKGVGDLSLQPIPAKPMDRHWATDQGLGAPALGLLYIA